MSQAGYLGQKGMRPGAAAAVVLLHGAAIGALLLVKNPEVITNAFTKTKVIDIQTPPPPPPPPPQPERPREQVTEYTVPPIPTPLPNHNNPVERDPPQQVPDRTSLASSENVAGTPNLPPRREEVVEQPKATPPEVVRIAARLVSGDLQPPYPASEQRLDREGRVVIRVTIGPDGRVRATEKVSATSDAFYEATARHARARWRFRPATVDGQAIESTKTMTVVFTLNEA